MKKIILSALVLSLTVAVKAQEIPERKTEKPRPMMQHQRGHHKSPGIMLHKLNLTEDQKAKFKAQHENFRKQMEELKKNDNITVKEWKAKMEALRKDNKAKLDGILTGEQKAQIEKMKAEQKAFHEIDAKARMEKMKLRLGLSDEQAAKMQQNRTEMTEKMRSIRENKSLNDEQKKEQIKELLKSNKEKMKSILTEEQLKKIKEMKHKRPDGPKQTI